MDEIKRNPMTRDLTNSKFGRWTVISFGGYVKTNAVWTCRCDCG